MVECKKAQPKEVMLPVQLNKSRAAAARNLYGLPPEQLLGRFFTKLTKIFSFLFLGVSFFSIRYLSTSIRVR
ncbi:unnamed protein product [Cylicostephanus goldi]|uniref:Uncharacterized protein n=1 Tax=Cylicostephanus goldi TaxID=71465 RepID=A0A3P6RL69_CYLGO|nr:unnamed protein product [Cylicostephanus goldi]